MFYELLSRYYDIVFPLKSPTLELLKANLPPNGRILDAACGTGTYSLALAQSRYMVYGIDLEPEMISQANRKLNELTSNGQLKEGQAVFEVRNMLDLEGLPEFTGVICLGNSLAHLPNRASVAQFIQKCRNKLSNEGSLILQIVNFDRILANGATELPLLGNEKVEFRRTYIPVSADKLTFASTLTILDTGESWENSIELRPITSHELREVLVEAGFTFNYFGDFMGSDYESRNSTALVVVAAKA